MLNNFSLTPEDAATIKRRRIVSIISIIIFIALSAAICWFVGKPLIEFVSEPDRFRLWVDSHGLWGRLAFDTKITGKQKNNSGANHCANNA